MWVVLGRVASYAILGAVATAIAGALLIAASGALVGAILDAHSRSPSGERMTFWGAAFGAVFGGGGGGIVGIFLLGNIGFLSAARRSFLPPKSILRAVIIGMSAATLAVMTSFFVFCAILPWLRGGSFAAFVEEGVFFILYAAPAVMVCGEIAGAIWGFRREKAALDA